MGNVLYELTFDWYDLFDTLSIVVFFEIGFFLISCQRKPQEVRLLGNRVHYKEAEDCKKEKNTKKSLKSIITKIVCIVLAVAVPILLGALSFSSYLDTEKLLKNNEYETVSGPVEDFHPMAKGGKDAESFVIDGVLFEYTQFESIHGYHDTYHYDGVIRSNGQELQIDYYVDEYGDKTILRIIDISEEN